MTPSSSHTALGFSVDVALGLIPTAITFTDINGMLQIAGAFLAILASSIRLYYLVKRGGKE